MESIQQVQVKLEYLEFHKCPVLSCSRVFLDAELFNTHVKHHEDMFLAHAVSAYIRIEQVKIYKCDYCRKQFVSRLQLLLHSLCHMDVDHAKENAKYGSNGRVKLYKCSECDREFVAESTLETHAVYHQPFPYICHCGIGYYQQTDLKSHKKLVHAPAVLQIEDTQHTGVINSSELINTKIPPQNRSSEPRPKIKAQLTFDRTCISVSPTLNKYRGALQSLQSHKKFVHDPGNLQIEYTRQDYGVIKTSEFNNMKIPPQNRRHKPRPKLKAELTFARTRVSLPPLNIYFDQNDDGRYECPDCTKTFNAKSNAQCHYRAIHRGERPYVCDLCGKAFTQTPALTAHLLIHAGRKDYPCQYCNKSFIKAHAQKLHERTHTGEKPYKCTSCEKAFSDPSAFARHQRIHTGDKRYRCEYCPKAFTDNSQLYVHRKRHINERSYRCTKCKKKFYTKSDLRKHFDVVHEKKYNFQCDYCKKDFSTKLNLQHHIQIHRDTRDTYTCDLCIKSFKDVQYLRKHIRTVHDRRRDYTCNICYKQFVNKSQLKMHLPIHNNVKKFECADCSRKYHSRSLLRAHIITKHINISCKVCKRNFTSSSGYRQHRLKVREKCDICEQEFDCKGEAQSHFNRVHVKRNVSTKYECNYCGRVFTQYLLIKKHILQLHSEYKHICDHCGERFALKESIRSHMKKHLEMLRCNICHKRFYSRFELQRHKETPCTLMTYTCDVCGKSLNSSNSLRRHKVVHMDDRELLRCPICSKKLFSKSSVIRHIRLMHNKDRFKK